MDDESRSPIDRLSDALTAGAHDDAVARLEGLTDAPPDDRAAAVRSLRTVAEENPGTLEPLCPVLVRFLTDEERPVRLSTAKLFVALASADASSVTAAVPDLAARLADGDEFYFVRARCAEALGYVAIDSPDAVASPEVLADLRVGLSFDEPEVRPKLAKALECVALGDPTRLRHQVSSLADHLADEDELVRYHLVTALVAVGCASPERLADARDPLRERLDDDVPHVRGRAAEALGLLARVEDVPPTALESVADDDPFIAERVAFALDSIRGGGADAGDVGTHEGVRRTTDAAAEAVESPDSDANCPHCGLALPEKGPPMCPRCGAPM